MNPPCPRPTRPLNRKAVKAADDALYAAHSKDQRPNDLFDTAGNRKPLSAADPKQECLRQEWVDLYGKNGGTLEKAKPTKTKPGAIVCPCPKAKLTVNVKYDPLTAPVKDAIITITGPVTKSEVTDATGIVKFVDLPPGVYTITSTYVGKDALVDLAASNVGKADWDAAASREVPPLDKFPVGSNKCNLFVYEMVTGSGYSVQTKKKWSYTRFTSVQLPPNAKDWASATAGSGSVVTTPEPGDIAAWPHDYLDATGHVGIVSYPQPSKPATKTLAPGEDASADLTMRRQTISAGSKLIIEDDSHFWHFWDEGNSAEAGKIVFRRLK